MVRRNRSREALNYTLYLNNNGVQSWNMKCVIFCGLLIHLTDWTLESCSRTVEKSIWPEPLNTLPCAALHQKALWSPLQQIIRSFISANVTHEGNNVSIRLAEWLVVRRPRQRWHWLVCVSWLGSIILPPLHWFVCNFPNAFLIQAHVTTCNTF